ncbi:MAG: ABC transporter ATP-binding protein, partial [Pseudomonadota bacterium]
ERATARKALAPLKAEVAAAEARLEKITELLERLDAMLADPALYDGLSEKIAALTQKRGELLATQEKAEEQWLAASERLEAAASAA